MRHIKHYIRIFLYIFIKKNLRPNFLWVLKFGQVEELPQWFSKSHFYADFFQNQSKSRLWQKKYNRFLLKMNSCKFSFFFDFQNPMLRRIKWTQIKFTRNSFIKFYSKSYNHIKIIRDFLFKFEDNFIFFVTFFFVRFSFKGFLIYNRMLILCFIMLIWRQFLFFCELFFVDSF